MNFRHTNKLIDQTSPYLLQHAHNPVNWYPWGEEALALAKEMNKPILVSIGYSACHWCHVMEKESFENEQVAEIMNERFVNIKIDREERPDLDAIYMDALQTIAGSGGWPLNVFLTPELKPFYGGTYFPPENAFNKRSWKDILLSVSTAWIERKEEINLQAENLTTHLIKMNTHLRSSINSSTVTLDDNFCEEIFKNLMKTADTEWGGFGQAPKFPQTYSIQYLLQYYHFYKNDESLQHALLSIDKILEGGIYDHAGGGIARYSTDREWLAPHFEKMLYDNALMISVLCEAFQITHNVKYEKAIRQIIKFTEREMMDPDGGFFSAIDADSEGEEGLFYVWQKSEIEQVLGSDAELFCKFFDVSEDGNWEGKNILRVLIPLEQFAIENKLNPGKFESRIAGNLERLLDHREKRVRPSLDDKMVLGWNALMIRAISKAACVLADNSLETLAIKNYKFAIKNFTKKSRVGLYHTYKAGTSKQDAFLDDYTYLAEACLNLYELTFDKEYLFDAKKYIELIIKDFSDAEGSLFYFTAKGASNLIYRKIDIYDGAIPSANGILAMLLHKLSVIFEDINWRNRSIKMATDYASLISKHPGSFSSWAVFLLQLINGFEEISVIGPEYIDFGRKITSKYIPDKIIICYNINDKHFMHASNISIDSKTRIFLCKKDRCLSPFISVESFFSSI